MIKYCYEVIELTGKERSGILKMNTHIPELKNNKIYGIFNNIKKEFVKAGKPFNERFYWSTSERNAKECSRQLNKRKECEP